MRCRFLNIFIFSIFVLFVFPMSVNANYGDLNYRITSVSINNSTVRLRGWAFIHRTNNYSGTNHTILLQAYNRTTGSVIETKTVSGSSGHDFYCQLYLKGGEGPNSCTSTSLKHTYHTCTNNSSGVGMGSKCYYENMDFNISFDVATWGNVSEDDEVVFRIAATNSDFRDKLSYTSYYGEYNYNGLDYTDPEEVYIPSNAVSGSTENDYITLDVSSVASKAEYIAAYAYLKPPNSSFTQGMAAFEQGGGVVGCSSNVYDLRGTDSTYYSIGVKISSSQVSYDFNGMTGYSWFYCPGNRYTFKGYASHMKVTGSSPFRITVRAGKKCDPVTPNSGHLYCNNNTVFNSDCEELTVRDESSGRSANVSISQTGTISAVLTPNIVHAGGGFNFGIVYTNSIKWSYAPGQSYPSYHSTIRSLMEAKIKNYNDYVLGIDITNLRFKGGDRYVDLEIPRMYKKCTASSTSKNYYNNELVVTCVFHITKSNVSSDGDVDYIINTIGSGMNNKYYTPMTAKGDYNVTATIADMNRLVHSKAKEDSTDENINWSTNTSNGKWADNVENCDIEVHPLFYTDSGQYNFIYRPIDLKDPFPNRNAGINWFDWYSVVSNKQRLLNTYTNGITYMIELDNQKINNIKSYNDSGHEYFDWDAMYTSYNGIRSSFVDDYFNTKRMNIIE